MSELKKEIDEGYYRITKENFFYMRDLMHKINENSNSNFINYSQTLSQTATVGIGFVSARIFLVNPDRIFSKSLLIVSFIFFFISMLFGLINYLIQQKFWENLLNFASKSTNHLNTTLTRMQDDEKNIKIYYEKSLAYQNDLQKNIKKKSKEWPVIVQFILLVLGILTLFSDVILYQLWK